MAHRRHLLKVTAAAEFIAAHKVPDTLTAHRGARVLDPFFINEAILFPLPLSERNSGKLLARETGTTRTQSAYAGLAQLGIVSRLDEYVFTTLPFPDVSLGHARDLRRRQVGEV